MGALIIPLFLFFQDGAQNSGRQPAVEAQRREAALHSVPEALGRESITTSETIRKVNASVQEQLFVENFNRLIYALMEFADDYKSGRTLSVKKAKAVREAWRKLEQAEALFRDDKKK